MTGEAAWPAPVATPGPDERSVERVLVDRARQDRAAFAALYRMHVDAVYRFAHRRGGSREVAEEATANTFERALRSFDRFEWRENGLRPWLFRIASNEVTEIHRRTARADRPRGQLALQSLAHGTAPAPDADSDGVDRSALRAALDRLPDRYRDVISLRYLAGLSAADAAAELGCSNRVLAVTLHRALGALRKELAADTKEVVVR